jgi:hypothetical protein
MVPMQVSAAFLGLEGGVADVTIKGGKSMRSTPPIFFITATLPC